MFSKPVRRGWRYRTLFLGSPHEINPLAEPARRPRLQQQLDEAKEAQLHLRAEMDERDSLQRREITRLKQNHQKEIQAFLSTTDQLTDQSSPPSIKSLQI